jgi:hypothetical protein
MKWSALLFAISIAVPAFAQGAATPAPAQGAVGQATSMTPAPDVRAKQWLGLLDDKNYTDAYKQMGAAAQGKSPLAAWAQKMSAAREPLGAMANRDIKSINMSKNLPGMSDGQNATVQFNSSFAHKASAVETVIMTSDKGAWSVTSYSVD